MSDTASAAGTPYPIPYVMVMQYAPDFGSMPHPLMVQKHKRYLDALFKPNLLNNPDIFYQEGWHYEILKPEDDAVYKSEV